MAIDKLIDHLPFFDGAGRRRFVAGGIILIGVAMQDPDMFRAVLGTEELDIKVILGSPVIAGGAVLLVYAIGSLAEMLGELSLVRAASGIFLALQFPGKIVTWDAVPNRHWFYGFLIIIMKLLLYVTVVPFMVLYFAAAGFVGYTRFAIDIHRRASDRAQAVFENLPDAAKRGLRQPVGNDSDFAQKHIVDLLTNEQDRKWARRLIFRAKDVAATITALQVVVLYTLLSFGIDMGDDGLNKGKSAQLQKIANEVTAAADALQAQDAYTLQAQDKSLRRLFYLDNIRAKMSGYNELAERDFPQNRIAGFRFQQRALESNRKSTEREIARLDKKLKKSKQTKAVQRSPKFELQGLVEDAGAKEARQVEEKRIVDKQSMLRQRLARLKRQTDYKDVLILVSGDSAKDQINGLQDAMSNYRAYFTAEQKQKVLTNLLLTGAWIFFLPLYLGYFATLRNAIVAILEAIAAGADNSAIVSEGAK